MTEEQMRREFEEWYAINAFDYAANPIGSRECGLQWGAWQACAARTVPDGFVVVPVELLQLIQCDVENSADWLSGATSALRNLLSAAPEGKN